MLGGLSAHGEIALPETRAPAPGGISAHVFPEMLQPHAVPDNQDSPPGDPSEGQLVEIVIQWLEGVKKADLYSTVVGGRALTVVPAPRPQGAVENRIPPGRWAVPSSAACGSWPSAARGSEYGRFTAFMAKAKQVFRKPPKGLEKGLAQIDWEIA